MTRPPTSCDPCLTWLGPASRDNHEDFRLLPAQAVHLVRHLAGEIQAIALFELELFAIELDRDPPADDEQHLLAGMERPLNRLACGGSNSVTT